MTSVPLTLMQLSGGMKRAFAGMPFLISVATGPGRIAFSRDATGELVVLPLHPGMELDVREHAFLLASHQIKYSFVRVKGLTNILFGGQGMFMDRFVTTNTPGLLILHGYGNVFERVLKAGESIMVEPGAFLYKDASGDDAGGVSETRRGVFRRHEHEPGAHDRARPCREFSRCTCIITRSRAIHMFCSNCGTGIGRRAVLRLAGCVWPERPLLGSTAGGTGAHRSASNQCPWCVSSLSPGDISCPRCGATLNARGRRPESGWAKLPGRKDMAKLQFGDSFCQIEGNYVPVADVNLAAATASTSPITYCCGKIRRSRSRRCRSAAAGSGCSRACRSS